MPHRVELRTEVEHVSVLGDVIQLKFMLENLIDEALSYLSLIHIWNKDTMFLGIRNKNSP